MTTTYEEVLALTQANSKAIDKLAASIAEMGANARAEQARRDKESAERAKEFAAEQARRDKESAERAKENAKLAKEFAKSQARWDGFMEKYGGFVDNDSRNTEKFFIEGLWQQDLVVGAIKFDDLIANSQRREKKVVAIELDGLLINGTTVGILEVKSTLHVKDVERVRDKRISRFRDYYPEHRDKKLAVMVAGKLINPDAAELARELGYIILKPNNQGISVDASCYRSA